ncbi:MAG: DNA gyrase C-terminal beta-propeller domain-containing protein, partial [Sulfobacillus sp.]
MLATRSGSVIRFEETEVRSMGRSAHGVHGIRLRNNDEVVSLAVVQNQPEILILTEHGFGKRTPFEQFRRTGRGGNGVIGIRVTPKTGAMVGLVPVFGNEQFMVISSEGTLIRMTVEGVSRQGRASQGVTIMRLEGDQQVMAFTLVAPDEDNEDDPEMI